MPHTNHVPTVHTVAAVLYLQSVLHVMLLLPCNMFCTFTSALPAVCVAMPNMAVFVVPFIIIIIIIIVIVNFQHTVICR